MGNARIASLTAVALVLSACPAGPGTGSPDGGPHFFFAQITDTHVGDKDGQQRTQQVVAALAATAFPLALVVHTGDLAERGDTQDVAKTELSKIPVPLHVLPGNHDMMEDASAQSFVSRWGALSSSAEYEGVVFLFVYDQAAPDYDPLDWLGKALGAAGEKPVIVFHHEPPVEDFYNNVLHPGWPEEKRQAWTALLEFHHVVADVAGHFHRDEQHLLGTIPLFVAAPVSGRFGRQAAWRIYEYDSGRLTYRTQYIEPQ
ncbi:MAG: metallophosphoesterase [Myxococcales bacterium]